MHTMAENRRTRKKNWNSGITTASERIQLKSREKKGRSMAIIIIYVDRREGKGRREKANKREQKKTEYVCMRELCIIIFMNMIVVCCMYLYTA